MTPVRLFDWRSRLSAYVGACLPLPFAWGAHDCVLFAAGGVAAMTGVDLAVDVRGQYGKRSEAHDLLRGAGHSGLEDLVATYFQAIPRSQAVDGDIAVFWNDKRQMLGLVVGEMIAAPGRWKLEFISEADPLEVFHVPFNGEVN